jgi:hypothetical protein
LNITSQTTITTIAKLCRSFFCLAPKGDDVLEGFHQSDTTPFPVKHHGYNSKTLPEFFALLQKEVMKWRCFINLAQYLLQPGITSPVLVDVFMLLHRCFDTIIVYLIQFKFITFVAPNKLYFNHLTNKLNEKTFSHYTALISHCCRVCTAS